MTQKKRLTVLAAVLILGNLCIASPVLSQRKDFNIYDGGRIPRSSQKRLVERLQLFTEYQRKNEWDKVSELLGGFISGASRIKYSVAQKEWIIERLQEKPLISFAPKNVSFSTAILDLPLARQWGYVEGDGEFINSGAASKEKAVIAPYRDEGEWYFSPMVVTSFGWEPLLKPASNKALQLTAR